MIFLHFDIQKSSSNYAQVVEITLEREYIRTLMIYELIYIKGVFNFL
jgi:hypothetical protein